MKKVTIVKIINPEKYKPFSKSYGILYDILENTAVINWDSNRGGMATNVSHADYSILPEYSWDIVEGEVVISRCNGYIRTGLKIWR